MINTENNTNNFIKILKGSLISIAVTIILLAIFSLVLTYSSISENTMPTMIILITILSILIGSQMTTRSIKNKGMLNGALVGIIYIGLLYLISSIVTSNFGFNTYSLVMILSSIIIGGLGGIIGVNTRKNK